MRSAARAGTRRRPSRTRTRQARAPFDAREWLRAITAFQETRKLPSSGKPDCETWKALGGDQTREVTVAYTVTDADTKGPFVETIPVDMMKQAALPSLGYTSVGVGTSVVPVRINCFPEITLHHLQCSA